jgi:hypothetical protein
VRFTLAAIRDGKEGVRGELTIRRAGAKVSWGTWSLASTTARDALRKRLEGTAAGPPCVFRSILNADSDRS